MVPESPSLPDVAQSPPARGLPARRAPRRLRHLSKNVLMSALRIKAWQTDTASIGKQQAL